MSTVIETAADHPDYRRIFVATFANEPSFRFMLPDERTREKHVAWLVDKKLALNGRSFHTLSTRDPIKGFSWWIPPGKVPHHSLRTQLKAGYWKGPLKFGMTSFRRMLRFGTQESRILKKVSERPHWILDVIATDPAYQRSGIGGALMKPIFEKAHHEGVPCFVLTHNPRNVGFYQKYGFKLTIEEPVDGPGSPIAYGLERAPLPL